MNDAELCQCCSSKGLSPTVDNRAPGITNCVCAFCCPAFHYGDIAGTFVEGEAPCAGQPTQAAVSYFLLSPFCCFSQWFICACPLTFSARHAMNKATGGTENEWETGCIACCCPQCSNAEVYRKMKTIRPDSATVFGAPRQQKMKKGVDWGAGGGTCSRYCRYGCKCSRTVQM